MSVLVASAWEPELDHFRSLASRRLGGAPLHVEPIGVGLVDAAIGAARCIARHAPTRALFIGTCGTFVPALAPRSGGVTVLAAASVRLVDAATLRGQAELPAAMETELALDEQMLSALVRSGGRRASVANTLGVTVDDALAADLARAADAEHLEGFAFARACAQHGIAAGLVLGIANPVGSDGRRAWRENHVHASTAAAEVAVRALELLFGV